VFPTTTKLDTRSVLGPDRLANVVQELDLPVVAIGGIQMSNIQTVRRSHPWKIAMSSALMQAGTLEGFCN
jgi:thiamine-phosphate pyrophosphorylase